MDSNRFTEIYNRINESKGMTLPTLRGMAFGVKEYSDLLDMCFHWVTYHTGNSRERLLDWINTELRTRRLKNTFTNINDANMELNSEFDRVEKERKIAVQIIQVQETFKPIAKEIKYELLRAIEKHPNYPKNKYEQLAILQEEVGEVTKAVLQLQQEGKGNIDDIKAELIQSAAMCIRMLLNM